VDELGSDTCHHCKGDMWHVCTAYVAGIVDVDVADTWLADGRIMR
jgi:hypothetical protein